MNYRLRGMTRQRKLFIAGALALALVLLVNERLRAPTTDPNVKIFYEKAKIAQGLNDATLEAIETANSDLFQAIKQLDEICPKAEEFLDTKWSDDGWKYPSDFPEKFAPYEVALTASIYSCYLPTHLREESWATFARQSAQFFQYHKCLDWVGFKKTEICPPNGILGE
jgi:hypothetical protein